MYGLAVNLIVSVSGHPWIINEINEMKYIFGCMVTRVAHLCFINEFSKK